MSDVPPAFDWSRRNEFNWLSEVGQRKMLNTIQPFTDFVADRYQLDLSGRILMGQDVFCINRTGGGKTAVIYIPAMVRQGTISLVISPTNFLEEDMVKSFAKKGISAIAINSETLAAAVLDGNRDLWEEAKTGRYRVIFIGPDTMRSSSYEGFIRHPAVHERIGQLTVDEVHLIDEWETDFRTAFQEISTMRAHLPDHTVFVALSASVEPGRQFDSCVRAMGFSSGKYHLEKRDCERHNVAWIMRPIKYSSSTHDFRDLDWVIPEHLSEVFYTVKRLIFCQSIELGHRLVLYLRRLLPPALQSISHILIRHHHSLNCPQCKSDGLASLYKVGAERDCIVHVSTDVLSVGVDIPGLAEVIIFAEVSSISVLVQRAGRPARERAALGRAIIYVKKRDLAEAKNYADSEEGHRDPRLLVEKDLTSHVIQPILDLSKPLGPTCRDTDSGSESDHDNDDEHIPAVTKEPAPPGQITAGRGTSKMAKKISIVETDGGPPPRPGKRVCMSFRLLVVAHVHHLCLTRQLNMIYENPGTSQDCGRCSSCTGDTDNIEARPIVSSEAPEQAPGAVQAMDAAAPLPAYMKLRAKDSKAIIGKLSKAARTMFWETTPHNPDMLFMGVGSFLPGDLLKKITHKFLQVTSIQALEARVKGWRYWEDYKVPLWNIVEALVNDMSEKLLIRHEEDLEKQRRKRTQAALVKAGLETVKRVILHLPNPLLQCVPSSSQDNVTFMPQEPVYVSPAPPDPKPKSGADPPQLTEPQREKRLRASSNKENIPTSAMSTHGQGARASGRK